MKRILLTAIFLLLLVSVSATEMDDLKFAAGLYADANLRLAATELESFIHTYPQSNFLSDAKYLLANTYFQQGRYAASAELYQDLLATNFSANLQAELNLGLAQSYFYLKKYRLAQAKLEEFLAEFSQHNQSSEAYYLLGKISQLKADYPAALEYYQAALKMNSSDRPKLQSARLNILVKLDREQQVDELYEIILRESSGDYRDYAILLWMDYKLQKQDFEKIVKRGLRKIRQDSPYFTEYKVLLGICYFEMNDFVKAREFLQGIEQEKARYYFALATIENNPEKAKDILLTLEKSQVEEIAVNSKFYLARVTEDQQQARAIFQDFIAQNPQHQFIGSAYYHLGFSYFQQGDYQSALPYLKQAEQKELDGKNQERLLFMLAECFYQTDQFQQAEKYQQLYLQNSDNQLFRAEIIFKQALKNYANQDYLLALRNFEQLTDFPQSDKLGMSYFYRGEILLLQGKLAKAKTAYRQALQYPVDSGFVNLRLAKIALQQNRLAEVDNFLQKIPEAEKYRFDLNLLQGNVALKRAKYPLALQSFLAAEEYVTSDAELELIISQKAFTLYQMKRFEQASRFYQQLSALNIQTGDYLLKAANAAFSAENYSEAIRLYDQFIQNFSEPNEVMTARLAIADSYYNLQNYQQALLNYRAIFTQTEDLDFLQNALNGLRWSSSFLADIELDQQLDLLLRKIGNSQIKKMLLAAKIDYLFEAERWQAASKSVDELAKISQRPQELYDYQLIQAICYAKLGKADQARELFQALEKQDVTADLYYNWATMELQADQQIEAVSILKKAAAIFQRQDIWLKLLRLQPLEMSKYYRQFKTFATDYAALQADIIWAKWRIEQQDYALVDDLENLKKTQYEDINAAAQYLLGYRLYQQQAYEQAIRELLRVRYLYPEINDVRIEAEYLACLSYLATQRNEEAKQLYQAISSELSEERRAELTAKLQGIE